ncbi:MULTISPECIES: hypothetical protein [Maribacter]|jgi:hypothetical protein|uniref:Glutaminyl-tRNA synthetase n=1 Tax=Maribacter flavus TaxID=1658664 RepID=A0A5B2TZ66_9FLAO|nr:MULTISPECIES: hypothetical protein [Maribacter]KAA2219851.1 hypothetical protein F0361_09770 [Maribacter flavus]MDC6405232.1 hypothetical protein [Maribacter sp. PR66]MEE1971959.1 hypothetical protein [Maribacter flavus]
MYNNFDEIEFDLQRLNLERQIAMEELKGLKQEVKEDLSPYNWLSTAISLVKKYGVLYLVKKILK